MFGVAIDITLKVAVRAITSCKGALSTLINLNFRLV